VERCPLLALIFIALGPAISPAQGQSFEFAFLGDNPYGGAFNVPKFQALIEDVNGWGDIEWGHRRQPGPHRKRDGHVRRGPHLAAGWAIPPYGSRVRFVVGPGSPTAHRVCGRTRRSGLLGRWWIQLAGRRHSYLLGGLLRVGGSRMGGRSRRANHSLRIPGWVIVFDRIDRAS